MKKEKRLTEKERERKSSQWKEKESALFNFIIFLLHH
jgi:hypothetical protein